MIPAMTGKRFQLNANCTTGVWPRGAHVRTTCGRSLNPDSSTKTIVRPSRAAFFNRGHSTRFQRRMAASSRSLVRPVGRRQFQLKPSDL